MALPLFALTLFVSAFLLFLVQPMIGKMILPKLGGTPQVWNTCMLFFQMTLLLGYFYTHTVSTRMTVRRQIALHGLLLFLPFLVLLPNGPFNITGWIPPAGSNPIWATLLLLAAVVGLPFFVVSTSAPLLQKWFANTGHPSGNDPYFLYGASNLGSLLSLICYPFLVEPIIPLRYQAYVWTVSYVILGALILLSAALVWKTAPRFAEVGGPALDVPPVGEIPQPPPTLAPLEVQTAVKPGPAPSSHRTSISRKKGVRQPLKPSIATPSIAAPKIDVSQPSQATVDWKRRLRWILLAFAPSSLMLGVTSYVSVDLSPFPLLWVIPLALYLLSFILVFAKWPVPWVGTPHDIMVFLGIPAIILLFFVIASKSGFDPFLSTVSCFGGFFLITMVCHGELAKDRPTTQHLTEYFLLMSVGGALGGLFNAMLAPQVFTGVAEFPIAIAVACFLRPTYRKDGWIDELLVNAGMGSWVRDTGDNIARAFGKTPPRNHWLLNYSLDVLFAIFIFLLVLFIKDHAHGSWGWYSSRGNGLISVMRWIVSEETANRWYARFLPVALYGPAMMFCMMFAFGRSFRFGLSMVALMWVAIAMAEDRRGLIYGKRSYFGVLQVLEEPDNLIYRDEDNQVKFIDPDIRIKDEKGKEVVKGTYTYLMHGTTYHGRNYHEPPLLRRVQTTYYHQKGPVGVIMDRYRWFKGGHGTFYADARLPVSMIGLGAAPLGTSILPLDQLSAIWTEPPYATIGLGSGTMAAYGRWLQHVTFYEIDENIRFFSLPPPVSPDSDVVNQRYLWRGKDPFFTYLTDAIGRGVNLEVIMGDARLSMAQERPEASAIYGVPKDKEHFYTKYPTPPGSFNSREHYYKVMEVDAFSSDAIPIHLTTKEAIELYLSKLAPDGVLMMHTSNRHMNLVAPITDIARELGKVYIRGHDVGRRDTPPFIGHFGSEYVMIANDVKYLPREQTINLGQGHQQDWDHPPAPRMRVWTDDYSNIVSILR